MREAKKKGGLGRGLSSLFDVDAPHLADVQPSEMAALSIPSVPHPVTSEEKKEKTVSTETSLQQKNPVLLPVSRVMPGKSQPRKTFTFDDLQELAGSIQTHGVLQPILVRPVDGTDTEHAQYEIVAGERRWRAAKMIGLDVIPVMIRMMSDQDALEMALIENVQRENLNPIEEAEAYGRLIHELGMTQEDLAVRVSKSRSHIANMLRLLSLPDTLKEYVKDGRLSMGHVRALLTLENPTEVGEHVLKSGHSVRETERLVARIKSGVTLGMMTRSTVSSHKIPTLAKGVRVSRETMSVSLEGKHPEIEGLEQHLQQMLGVACHIEISPEGKGQLIMHFQTFHDLDHMLTMLMSVDTAKNREDNRPNPNRS